MQGKILSGKQYPETVVLLSGWAPGPGHPGMHPVDLVITSVSPRFSLFISVIGERDPLPSDAEQWGQCKVWWDTLQPILYSAFYSVVLAWRAVEQGQRCRDELVQCSLRWQMFWGEIKIQEAWTFFLQKEYMAFKHVDPSRSDQFGPVLVQTLIFTDEETSEQSH